MASQTMDGNNASPAPVPTPEDIAGSFPQFEILGCLGRGGMGVVYKALQKSLNRKVAIKILAPERVGQEKFAERFAREAQTLAQLNHPNIVTVFDYGETVGLYYFVMEFVDGVNLRDLLNDGKLEPQQALTIVPPVCEALQYAHDKGIVHRDIKPENMLLDKEGRVKIADFGIAALVGAESETSGTPPYMAPEQAGPSPEVDHRADIYALGVVLYEMLTGERPNKELVAPSRKVQVDVRLDEIVLRALEKNPELRYQQASIFKTQVETIASTSGQGAAQAEPENTKADRGQTIHPPAARSNNNLPPSHPAARLSRTAISGACWAALFLVIFPLIFLLYRGVDPHSDAQLHSVWAPKLMMLLVVIFGIAAPFGTTILGWVAVSQIRRSAGKIYGMGLAVVDGLLLPLLVLDAGMVSAIVRVSSHQHQINPPESGHPYGGFNEVDGSLLLLILAACFVVDYFIIREVWRAVCKPAGYQNSNRTGIMENPVHSSLPTSPPMGATEKKIRDLVKGPALGMIIVGQLNCVICALVFIWLASRINTPVHYENNSGWSPKIGTSPVGLVGLLVLVSLVLNGFIIYAGFIMMHLKRRGAALTASILLMIFSPVYLIGLAIGIWSLVVLCRDDVRSAFIRRKG